MDIQTKFIYIATDMILPIGVGYFLRSRNKFNDPFFNKMMLINVLALYPLLSILTFWVLPLNGQFAWLPLLGLLMSAVAGAEAWRRAEKKFSDNLEKGSYIISAILSNILTLGGLCVYIIYGEAGFAYTQLVQLLQSLVLFMFCFPLAQYYRRKSDAGTMKSISLVEIIFHRNQLPVLGLLIGIGLHYSGISRPNWAGIIVDPLVHVAAWTALMPVGYSIDPGRIRDYWRATLDMAFIKFIVTPAVTCFAAWLVIDDLVVLRTVAILAATPAAINAVITAKIHDLNIHVAMAAFMLTNLIYILIVYPAMFLYFTMF